MSDYCVKISVKSDNHALHNLSSNPTDKVSEFDNNQIGVFLIMQCLNFQNFVWYSGVQRINDVFHIVDKVENVFFYTHIFNLTDNVECVVDALNSSIYVVYVVNLNLVSYEVLISIKLYQIGNYFCITFTL
jgi:hypothetical protein